MRIRVAITGQVQGVGFRPYVYSRAVAAGLAGFVRNDSRGVVIELEGGADEVAEYLKTFVEHAPPLAVIDSLTSEAISERNETGFVIVESERIAEASTPIAPDVSICADCLHELRDPADRRYGYPFINCTNCGPRFTIIRDIPYDRPMTTMASFQMCPRCRAEYDDPTNRRFHAQPNACAECGPKIWYAEKAELDRAIEKPAHPESAAGRAVEKFAAAMAAGKIVAVKGIGGFHLACEAANPEAIARLRERKGRIEKPFAVMAADVEAAATFAVIGEQERRLLESKERPILLLAKRRGTPFESMLEGLAPHNGFVGVMLPYSPLHYLLLKNSPPLLMTSGNRADEPIVRTGREAAERLVDLADAFLLHDREIDVVCDDSVVRCIENKVLPIRRSRGYAPMPVRLAREGPCVLALGGEIKATFCVTKGSYAYLSQHIGDVGNLETLEALRYNVDRFLQLFRVNVQAVAADLHPEYLSHRWGKELARRLGVPFFGVQHHFAHAAAIGAEYFGGEDRPMLACAFDGTGYGEDGAIWGGEFLLPGEAKDARFAHLAYFPLPGGDAGVKRPYRAALALLKQCGIAWEERLPCVSAAPEQERSLLNRQIERKLHCPLTSSMGRLFDAVSSLIGARHEASYEAQAAMELEALAAGALQRADPAAYSFTISLGEPIAIEYGTLLTSIAEDVLSGVDRGRIAAQFHCAVAAMAETICLQAREKREIRTIGLTGGVFQNVLLMKLVKERLLARGFEVLDHHLVPPNDGGLALGQALIARRRLTELESRLEGE